jgi:ketosteroid isomerase-like protein
MSRSLRVFLFALLAVSAAVTHARAADMDSRAQVLIKLDDEWSKTAATKDAHKVASYYAENALAYPPNDVQANGRDAAEKVWASFFAAPDFKIAWKTTHAEVSKSGDMGYTAGTYEDSYTGPDGKTVSEKGKYVCVWAKQKDGSWKAAHDIWNSDTK